MERATPPPTRDGSPRYEPFPSLSRSTTAAATVPTGGTVAADPGRWSSVARTGHEERVEAERARVERERERAARKEREMEGGFARLETLGGGGSELCVDGWRCALGYDQIDSADDGDGDDEGVREEEACRPPSPLTFPATTATAAYDRRRQGTNIVRALDGDRLRNRWSSLVEGMHRR